MLINELIQYATSKDWDQVDEVIPTICNNEEYVTWSYTSGLQHPNEHVRDLAASVLEQSSTWTPAILDRLRERLSDDAPYARFRAACAIANHEKQLGETAKGVLKKFSRDEDTDVARIAKSYLTKFA